MMTELYYIVWARFQKKTRISTKKI